MSKSQYELIDPSGRVFRIPSFESLVTELQEGKVFPSTRIKGGQGSGMMVGGLPGVQETIQSLISGPTTSEADGNGHSALSGNLGPLSVAKCLVHIARNHLSGRLYALESQDQKTVVVVFRQGACCAALSDDSSSYLGHMLVEMGLVPGEGLESVIDDRGQDKIPLGQALVRAGFLDEAQLKATLTLQSVVRLARIFSSRSGVFRFQETTIDDRDPVRMSLSLRDLLCAGLGVGLDDRQLTGALAPYEQNAMEARQDPFTASQIESKDQQFLGAFQNGISIRNALPMLEQRFGSSPREVRLRLLTLIYIGALGEHGKQTRELEQTLRKVQRMGYGDLLGVRRGVTPEEAEEAYQTRMDTYGAYPHAGETPDVTAIRTQIGDRLGKAREVMCDSALSNVYFEAKRTGADFEDEHIRADLLVAHHLRQGRSSLANQAYGDAESAFAAAIENGATDNEVRIQGAWAGFLNSPQKSPDADHAITRMDQDLGQARDSVDAMLVKGKILRLAGELERAKKYLNRVVALDSANHEAYAQLRLLNTRKGTNSVVPSISFEVSEGVSTVIGICVVAIALCYVFTIYLPGSYTEWPDVETANVTRSGTNNMDKRLVERIYARLDPERDLTIPPAERVLGSVEFYYLSSDPWFWGRRGLLLIFAILGIAAVTRKEREPMVLLGPGGEWIFVALIYGLLAGIFSPIMQTPTSIWPLLGMTVFHVFAEQLFFIAFAGRALLRRFNEPLLAVAVVAVLYGVYQLTFFATLNSPANVLLTTVPQVAVFAGGAYTFLLWKSGGLLTPLLAHLLINVSVAVRSAVQGLA